MHKPLLNYWIIWYTSTFADKTKDLCQVLEKKQVLYKNNKKFAQSLSVRI